MQHITLLSIIFSVITLNANSQSVKELSLFPEDYLNKTITYKDIWVYPTLNDQGGKEMYNIMLHLNEVGNPFDEIDYAFGSMKKIKAVVHKPLAKKLFEVGWGGYNNVHQSEYIKGTVIKAENYFGSEYLFVISEIKFEGKIMN